MTKLKEALDIANDNLDDLHSMRGVNNTLSYSDVMNLSMQLRASVHGLYYAAKENIEGLTDIITYETVSNQPIKEIATKARQESLEQDQPVEQRYITLRCAMVEILDEIEKQDKLLKSLER